MLVTQSRPDRQREGSMVHKETETKSNVSRVLPLQTNHLSDGGKFKKVELKNLLCF